MNPQTFIVCIIIIAAAVVYIQHRTRRQDPEHYDAAELTDAIRLLSKLSDNLENADRMIEDLNACNPRELLRGFRANWCGIDGKRRSIDFMADGRNGATFGLKQAAQDQRDRVNAQIIDLIRAMNTALDAGTAPALQLDAVGETVDETTEADAVGEW